MSYRAMVIETEEAELKVGAVLFSGFPGPGLAGPIAVIEIIRQSNMKEIAYIKSPLIPPVVVFLEGVLRHPIRIHVNQNNDLLAVISEIPLPSNALYHIGGALVDWASKKGVKEIICLEGIPPNGIPKKSQVCVVAEPEVIEELKKYEIICHDGGYVAGISAAILDECLARRIRGICFLTPANPKMPDPKAAIDLLSKMNDLYDLKIDTKELVEQAEKLKNYMKETVEHYTKIAESEPETYKMYV